MMLKDWETSFQNVIWYLVWPGSLIRRQFFDSSFDLFHGDGEICGHSFWIDCVCHVPKICSWRRWKEGIAQYDRFLLVGRCLAFQCGVIGISGDGIEICIDLKTTAVVR